MTVKNNVNVLLKKGYMGAVTCVSSYYQKRQPAPTVKPEKIAYFMSFPANDGGLIAQLGQSFSPKNILIFYTKNCRKEAEDYKEKGFAIFPLDDVLRLFSQSLKILTTVRWVICDNYFPILSGISFHEQCEVIQIWHATGAIKKFGWEDPQTSLRQSADQDRFKKVYQRFDYYLVASDAMAAVFERSYGAKAKAILPFGCHRSDQLIDTKEKQPLSVASQRPKVLYAPTYRDDNSVIIETLEVLNQIAKEEKQRIFYQLHPVTKANIPDLGQWEYIQASSVLAENTGDLYRNIDCLITDYSSVPFDYSLANPTGCIQFYWPDFQAYLEKTGIQESIIRTYGSTALYTPSDLINGINEQQSIDLEVFNQTWNQYNKGTAQTQLVTFIKEQT